MKVKRKVRVTEEREMDIALVSIDIPLREGNEDLPEDFPFRDGDRWAVKFTPDGKIQGWTEEHTAWFEKNEDLVGEVKGCYLLYINVDDGGTYKLYDSAGEVIASLEEEYIPSLLPNEYGDDLILHISDTGVILNLFEVWDVTDFFKKR